MKRAKYLLERLLFQSDIAEKLKLLHKNVILFFQEEVPLKSNSYYTVVTVFDYFAWRTTKVVIIILARDL